MTLSAWWADQDPRNAAALEEARKIIDREVETTCSFGSCIVCVDPVTNLIGGGFGPVGCPCENLPGGNAKHPEGRPMPAVPVKATGRHGSRVTRSQKRHELPPWLVELTA